MRALARILVLAVLISTMNLEKLEAGSRIIQVQWAELPPLIVGNEINVVLSNSAILRGTALAVRADSVLIDVKKTSDKITYPKGQTDVQCTSMSSLELWNRTIRWRVVGTSAGVGGGFLLGGFLSFLMWNPLPFFLVPAGAGAFGHAAGREGDLRKTKIEIVGHAGGC